MMGNPNDFIIENGVLKKYVGPGGDVVVPEGVTSIGQKAFDHIRQLKSVALPAGLNGIGIGAFEGCMDKLLAELEEADARMMLLTIRNEEQA